jgi:hypothetical protein
MAPGIPCDTAGGADWVVGLPVRSARGRFGLREAVGRFPTSFEVVLPPARAAMCMTTSTAMPHVTTQTSGSARTLPGPCEAGLDRATGSL